MRRPSDGRAVDEDEVVVVDDDLERSAQAQLAAEGGDELDLGPGEVEACRGDEQVPHRRRFDDVLEGCVVQHDVVHRPLEVADVDAEAGAGVALRIEVDDEGPVAEVGQRRPRGSRPWSSCRRHPSGWPRRRSEEVGATVSAATSSGAPSDSLAGRDIDGTSFQDLGGPEPGRARAAASYRSAATSGHALARSTWNIGSRVRAKRTPAGPGRPTFHVERWRPGRRPSRRDSEDRLLQRPSRVAVKTRLDLRARGVAAGGTQLVPAEPDDR